MKNPPFLKVISISLFVGLLTTVPTPIPAALAQSETGEADLLNLPAAEIKPAAGIETPPPEDSPHEINTLQSLPDSVPPSPNPTSIEALPEPTQSPLDLQSTITPEILQDEFDSTCQSVSVQIEPINLGVVTISPPPNCNHTQYETGTELTISARPVPGFKEWSGDFSSTQNPLTVTVESDIHLTAHFVQTNPPRVDRMDTLPQTSDKKLDENEISSVAIQSFFLFFSKAMLDRPGHSEIDDITFPGNYSLTHLGADLIADSEDDQEYEINSVSYSAMERKATVFLNNSTGLPAGIYQLRLNGADSIQDQEGNKLDGDSDGLGGDDYIRTFFININPSVPIPISPRQNAYSNNPSPEFTWTMALNAIRYQFQIDSDKQFKTPDVDIILEEGATSFIPASPLSSGKYFWRVRGFNLFGISGKWGSVQSFQLDTTPPSEPIPQKPLYGFSTNDTTPAFAWNKAKDAKYYRLQIANNLEFASPLVNILSELSTYTLPDTAALDYGAYFWRIRAEDMAGNNSNWSKPYSLVISFMKSPINEAHVDQSAPTVEWYPVTNAKAYQIQVSSDEQFNEILQFENYIPAPNTSVKLQSRATGVYFWRMCAIMNPTSECKSWLQPMKFTISPNPGIPLLTFPARKQILNDNTPELTWEQVLHGELTEPHHYEIQIDEDTKFLSPLVSGTTAASETAFISTILRDGGYFWRVRAVNYLGHSGAWSTIQDFRIDTLIPAEPVIISPNVNAYTTDSTPKFSWRASKGASNYEFELSNDQFTSLLKKTTLKNSVYILPNDHALDFGRYQWRVASRDQAGNQSPWKTIDSFDITYQKAPYNNAFIGERPVFKWNKVSGAQHYRLQISNDVLFNATTLDDANIQGNAVSYPPINLPIGQYYWRMQVQILGSWSNWTPAWKFNITPQPGIPSLIEPSPAAFFKTLPEFTWHEVPQGNLPIPHAYQIQVSRSASFPTTATIIDATTLSGVNTYSPAQLSDGVYFWRCRAINGLDLAGRWSIIYKFTLDTKSPLPPIPVEPANNARISNSAPAFKWKTQPGAVQYQFQLSKSSSFDVVEIDQSVTKPVLLISNSNQLDFGTYYWRVKAVDAAGNESEWSALQSLEINFMKLPAQSAYLVAQNPSLSWEKLAGAQAFHLQVDNSADFSTPIINSDAIQSSINRQNVQLEFGSYYWRMKLLTPAGWSDWMPVGEFIISPPVAAPFLLTPFDKATTTDRTPSFFWILTATNGLPGKNRYELQVSTSQTFATVQQNCDTAAGQTTCTLDELATGNYYWRVRSINPLGYASAWSQKRNLLIE